MWPSWSKLSPGKVAALPCKAAPCLCSRISRDMIRKLKSGEYRLYSKKKDASTGKRKNLGTFASREKAEKHERDVQYFKKH